jgi:GT2 family glycosyltransferase
MAKMEGRKTKVLIGIVTAQAKDYCFDVFCRSLARLTYPADILFVDNSEDPEHVKKIQKRYPAIHMRTGHNLIEIMANCNEYLQKKAMDEQYTHLLSLESDIIIRNDSIDYMLSFKKPVIGLPYFIGHSFLSFLMQFDCETFGYQRNVFPMNGIMSFHEFDGEPKRAIQIGLGCLLIRRDVLARVKFKIDPRYTQYHMDSSLHLQLQEMNIPVYLAQEYVLTHYNTSWSKVKNK